MSDLPESDEYVEVVDTFGREAGYIDLIVPVVLVAFTALCIWLAVRIINRRERWAKWTALGLAILMGYPLSWGPAIWLFTFGGLPSWAVSLIYYAYAPIGWVANLSEPTTILLRQYSYWWVPS
jgi:hypothetical protein